MHRRAPRLNASANLFWRYRMATAEEPLDAGAQAVEAGNFDVYTMERAVEGIGRDEGIDIRLGVVERREGHWARVLGSDRDVDSEVVWVDRVGSARARHFRAVAALGLCRVHPADCPTFPSQMTVMATASTGIRRMSGEVFTAFREGYSSTPNGPQLSSAHITTLPSRANRPHKMDEPDELLTSSLSSVASDTTSCDASYRIQ